MRDDLFLRTKWTFRAQGQNGKKAVFVKKNREGSNHVVMKALLWALYLPEYPDLMIEVSIGDRYKPDLVELDPQCKPNFWGESGRVGAKKIHRLIKRFPNTHFAFGKWHTDLAPLASIIRKVVSKASFRTAPIDLISFPPDSAERFIWADGQIQIQLAELNWKRIGNESRRS